MSFNVPNEIFLSILEGNVASVSLRVERHLREREPSESFVATQHLDLHETDCGTVRKFWVIALLQWVHSDSPSNQSDSFENTLIEQVRLLQEQRKTSQAYLKKRRAKVSVSA